MRVSFKDKKNNKLFERNKCATCGHVSYVFKSIWLNCIVCQNDFKARHIQQVTCGNETCKDVNRRLSRAKNYKRDHPYYRKILFRKEMLRRYIEILSQGKTNA